MFILTRKMEVVLMKIYVLADNHASTKCKAEWGLSLFIESSKKILFDFGASDLFLQNAEKLKLNVNDADYFVLSHGHWDHGNGLAYLSDKKLVCHPEVFLKRYSGSRYIGLPFSYDKAQENFELITSTIPVKIDENITYLGEIPRITEFEGKNSVFKKEDGSVDNIRDDSALAITTEQGLVIITGCAHAGICNTIEYAKTISGVQKVYAVMGGFHLQGQDEVTSKTIEYLKGQKIQKIMPSHCTEFPALAEFYLKLGSSPYKAGQIIEL